MMKAIEAFKAHMAILTIEQRRAMTPEQLEELKIQFEVPPPPFEVGDVVQMKSGGSLLTVSELVGLERVRILSFKDDELSDFEVPWAILKKAE